MKAARRSRRLHRLLVPLAAAPLALTSLSGGIYGTTLSFNIDAPWLLRLHTGNFGVINLQPFYSPLLAILTLVLVISGVSLLLRSGRARPSPEQEP
ncbi:MAG: hypothetical protein ACKOCA_10035 [Vulcanococcus sp.]